MTHLRFLILLSAIVSACARTTATTTATAASDSVQVAIAKPRVGFITGDGRRSSVEIELARTPDERERGLMFRKTLAPDAGMLFVFDDDQDHMFWMKNTDIPLDMIFINQDNVVVGVVRDATPQTETPRGVNHGSRYVLEVNAGWAAMKGVDTGARADLSAAFR